MSTLQVAPDGRAEAAPSSIAAAFAGTRGVRRAWWAVVIVGSVLGLYYAATLKRLGDQDQMLEKGLRLAYDGIWTHYGNYSAAGMGNIPGSLSTALIGVPLLLWNSFWAPLLLVAALHLAALLLLDDVVKREFTPGQRLAFVAMFWLTPWRLSETAIWNPDYLVFAAALHLWTAYRLRAGPSFACTFLHVLAIAFAFQLHNSSVILAIISGYLWLRGLLKVSWPGLAAAAGLAAASLAPYLQSVSIDPSLSPAITDEGKFVGRGIARVGPMLKGISYWPRYTSLYFSRYIFRWIDFGWIEPGTARSLVDAAFAGVRWAVAVPSLVVSWAVFGRLLQDVWTLRRRRFVASSWVSNYVISGLLALVLTAALSPITFTHWHYLMLVPVIYLAFVRSPIWSSRPALWRRALAATLAYMVAYNVLAASGSFRQSLRDNMHREPVSEVAGRLLSGSRSLRPPGSLRVAEASPGAGTCQPPDPGTDYRGPNSAP